VTPRGRIVVAGRFADVSGQAGATWAVMQYVLGLCELGYDVWALEPIADAAAASRRSLRPIRAWFERTVAEFGLAGKAALLLGGDRDRAGVGATRRTIRRVCADADLLLNISGVLRDPALLELFSTRVYLDVDPAFNQFWHAGGVDRGFSAHTHHFTVGVTVGEPDCTVPTFGLRWRPTVPPVVLERWPVAPLAPAGAYTTIGNWRSYGSIHAGGVFYGQKAHSLRLLSELPLRSPEQFRLALAIHPDEKADLRMLGAQGWHLADPARVASSTAAYRGFIATSKAEIGIAKAGYVRSRCGWFSDRSACYLASGRPVVCHDTGFGSRLPSGQGLLCFGSLDGAVEAIEAVACDYTSHARAAREIAESHLDSRRVLEQMIDEVQPQ